MKSTKGFTLVEMLVVVGLLALLMAAMTVSLAGAPFLGRPVALAVAVLAVAAGCRGGYPRT